MSPFLRPIALLSVQALVLMMSVQTLEAQPQLQLTQVSDRAGVVEIANAGDGSGRVFLVRQFGRIDIHLNGEDLPTPFLDISNRVGTADNEQGLLSLAFAPDYATSGHFYVWYTDSGGGTILSRFSVSEDPAVADPDSEQIVLIVPQPYSNHNGGRLQFGPDGMLYLGLGDGGGSFDPEDAGQDGSTLLGKLIRIDVDPEHGTYGVPADNPFVGDDGVRDEIWATGLRNPWRITFDRATGDLYIADVGQNRYEEVNFQAAASNGGENYGWDIMEGAHCTGGGDACDQSGLTLPVVEYDHDSGCSITGGEVYRGSAYPDMQGMYVYGDYCTGLIWGLQRDGEQWTSTLLADTPHNILTFGLGEDGSVYMASQAGGIYLLSDGEPVPESFAINAGLNDAWYDPGTAGQGFLITVFPDDQSLFLAWFTYDVERPPEGTEALLGEPGHRWLTAQGPYTQNTATLTIYVSSGGVFDSAVPAVGPPTPDGSLAVTWTGCNSALLSYEIDSLGVSGEIPLQRIAADNIALCQALR